MTDPQTDTASPPGQTFTSTTDIDPALLTDPQELTDQVRRVVTSGMETLRGQAIEEGLLPDTDPSRVQVVLTLLAVKGTRDPDTPDDCAACAEWDHVACTGTTPAANGEGMVACACADRHHTSIVAYNLGDQP